MELGVVSTRITAADRTEHMKRLRHTSRLPFAPGGCPWGGSWLWNLSLGSAFGEPLSVLSDRLRTFSPSPCAHCPLSCSLEPAPGSPAQGAPQPARGCSRGRAGRGHGTAGQGGAASRAAGGHQDRPG